MITRAALWAGTGVALGAFGAHGLKATLEARGRLDDWHTAVFYQLVHALALLALGIWARVEPSHRASRSLRTVGVLFQCGVLFFSGSLYLLGLGVPVRWLWPVTPLGGVCFLAGWIVLAIGGWRLGAASRQRE